MPVAEHPVTRDGRALTAETLEPLLSAAGEVPLPPVADRAAWSEVAERPWIARVLPDILERAERVAHDGPGTVKATDYLDFFRTGSRAAHQASARPRAARLGLLLTAECLEGEGRFLDAMLDLSWAMAEETSWVMPPHLQQFVDDVLPDVTRPGMDLRTARVAATLGEMMWLLGEQMDAVSPNWRKRIQFELQRQAVGPYLEHDFHWQQSTSNWNAVCTGGPVTAALLADFDTVTRARVLAKALRSVGPFLRGFASDGGCSEGPGYWSYGVGHYSRTAYYVHCATGGEVDLLADPRMPAIYAYPAKMVLHGQRVVNFADSAWTVGFRNGAVAWAAERLGVLDTRTLASRADGENLYPTHPLNAWLSPEPAEFRPSAQAVMPDLQVAVARAEAEDGREMVLAGKGGHNGEHHNHNDVGSFIVCVDGESLICDLGKGEYVKEFFGPRRYEFLTTRSLGHNVPLLNGCEQAPGAEFRARGFDAQVGPEGLTVAMDLAAAYPPEAGIGRLERTLTLRRGGEPAVELLDAFSFREGAGTYELPLYTEGRFEAAPEGGFIARGRHGALRVEVAGAEVSLEVEQVEHEDATLRKRFGETLPRCRLRVRPGSAGAEVRINFRPGP